jgi:hypothetical protein
MAESAVWCSSPALFLHKTLAKIRAELVLNEVKDWWILIPPLWRDNRSFNGLGPT